MAKMNLPIAEEVLDSLNDGLYVTDTDRHILYWNKSAERITGWTAEDVVGHRCMDNILIHEDKDGRCLCLTNFCPLHRCMVTDRMSSSPLIAFAQTKTGGRVPVAVSVAPLHDADGEVSGAVETFQDYSEIYENLGRAKRIQTLSLEQDLPKDDRVGFASFYLPHDMIGGDYFAICQLDADHYGFILADVMGHGVAASLHTMHLSSLWRRYRNTLMHPVKFAQILNRNLYSIVKGESFATAICGVLDASEKRVRIASAGGPPLVLLHSDGRTDQVSAPGLPFGMIADADYDESEFLCTSGDSLLMFTDGAVEIHDAHGRMLGTEGLTGILNSLGYPKSSLGIEPLEEALLNFSNEIRLDDDLTLLEVRFS
jgi:phosphoserine phosphatase RsbU/P